MRILTLNEQGLVAGGRMMQSTAHPDLYPPIHLGGGGDDYGGYGGGYGIVNAGSYSGAGGGYNGFELFYNTSNPSVIDTVPISSNVTTLPTVEVTAPVNTSNEPTAFEGFIDDVAGATAASLCSLATSGAGTYACAVYGIGVADLLKANQPLLNSIHTDGAWSCAKLGNCYEYDRANGIK